MRRTFEISFAILALCALAAWATLAWAQPQPKKTGIEGEDYQWNEQLGEKVEALQLTGDLENGEEAYRGTEWKPLAGFPWRSAVGYGASNFTIEIAIDSSLKDEAVPGNTVRGTASSEDGRVHDVACTFKERGKVRIVVSTPKRTLAFEAPYTLGN